MRTIILNILLFIFFAANVFAQDTESKFGKDPEESKKNRSLYMEDYKMKSYDQAFISWKYCIDNCPKVTKNLYIHGPKLIKHKLKNAKTEAEKNKYKQLLVKVYDLRLKHFPGKESYVLSKKAMDMLQLEIGTIQEVNDIFKKAYDLDKTKLSAPMMYGYFMSSVKLFGKKQLKIDDVFSLYGEIMDNLDIKGSDFEKQIVIYNAKTKLSSKEKKKLSDLKKKLKRASKSIRKKINKVIAPIAKCDKLVPLYTKNFEENKENIGWIKTSLRMLISKKCTDAPIYLKIAKVMYAKEPSVKVARIIAMKELKNKNYKQALTYLEKSFAEEEDVELKANDKLTMAKIKLAQGKKSQARAVALEASKLRKNWGEPHIFIGNLYANSANNCGKNAFQKKAVYWLAVDEFRKATKDRTVLKQANKLIKSYLPLTPSKTMIFQFGYNKKKYYQIKCWIQRKVSIPKG